MANSLTTVFVQGLLLGWDRNAPYAAKLVGDLTDEQMVQQPRPGMNHPAWTLSHLNLYHDVLVALLTHAPFADPKDHQYGMTSKPVADRSAYASKADLIGTFQAGHDRVRSALLEAPPDVFEAAIPLERWKPSFPLVGTILGYLMLSHESTHLGQLSAWRRAMGLPSV
jgi:hypothetical protein